MRKIQIYWDISDPQDKGWAYRYWDGDWEDSGGLDNTDPEADDEELLDEVRRLGYVFDEFEIKRS